MSNRKLTQEEVVKALGLKFIKHEEFAKTLWVAYTTNKNAIFWGPGGHGKSEMAQHFFNHFGIDVFVQALGDGSQEETLLGGINVKALKDEGKIEYLVENSFMNHEYVVFEELLDCPSSVLLRLKDILTSGYFRNGTQQFKIKTKMIVALTNRSREEVAEDRSVQALMERFPIDLNVIWDSYEVKDFNMMFKKVLGKEYPILAEAIAESNKTSFISPRTAIHAAQVYEAGGLSALSTITGFNINVINKLKQNEKKILEEMETANFLTQVLNYATHISEKVRRSNNVVELLEYSSALDVMSSKLAAVSVTDKNISTYKTIQELIVSAGTTASTAAVERIKTPKEILDDLDNLFNKKYEKLSYQAQPATSGI